MGWEVILLDEVDAWFLALCETDPTSAELVEAAINVLELEGPPSAGHWPIASSIRAIPT